MTRCIFDGVACAYCSKHDEERKISLRLIEVIAVDFKDYIWPHFNCTEQFNCEEFDRLNGCPFIREVYEHHK